MGKIGGRVSEKKCIIQQTDFIHLLLLVKFQISKGVKIHHIQNSEPFNSSKWQIFRL